MRLTIKESSPSNIALEKKFFLNLYAIKIIKKVAIIPAIVPKNLKITSIKAKIEIKNNKPRVYFKISIKKLFFTSVFIL